MSVASTAIPPNGERRLHVKQRKHPTAATTISPTTVARIRLQGTQILRIREWWMADSNSITAKAPTVVEFFRKIRVRAARQYQVPGTTRYQVPGTCSECTYFTQIFGNRDTNIWKPGRLQDTCTKKSSTCMFSIVRLIGERCCVRG